MENTAMIFFLCVVGVVCGSGQSNVLLIVVDDLRPTLGCYGDPLAITPNIDALAQHGTVFTRAYAQQALCGPSRTSFLTSRRPDTTRLYDVHSYWRRHAGNFTTLPQYFKEHGYHTASAGKVFHPGIVSNHNDDQPYSWSEAPYHPPTQAHKQDPVCLGADGRLHTNIYCPVQVEEQPGGSLPDIETTHYARDWLEHWAATKPQQPFFFAVGFHKPHIPLKFPKQFLDLYPISSVPLAPNRRLPPGLPPVAWNPWNDLRYREDIAALNVSFPYGPMPDFYARYIRQGYYAATSYTDSLIGDLLGIANNLFPDTIIALIGDHGWSLGEHQEWSKFSNFEVSTRVPFIISRRRSPAWSLSKNFGMSLSRAKEMDPILLHNRQSQSYTPNSSASKWSQITEYSLRQQSPLKGNMSRSGVLGSEYRGLVELVDLFPTLVDMAGLPTLSPCPQESRHIKVCTEGSSLTPILSDNRKETFPWTTGRNPWESFDTQPVDSHIERNSNPENVESNDLKSLWKHQGEISGRSRKISSKLNYYHGTKTTTVKPLSHRGIKKAAFSQYPRPGPVPSRDPDSDQPHTRDTTIMGYSVRTLQFRYTAWLRFDNVTYKPDWNHIVAQELYDHKVDPLEDHNMIGKALYARKRSRLNKMLRSGWRHSLL